MKHGISFKNTTGQPLTTASATILARGEPNSKFLVQGLMKFTGVDREATIEITNTMEVEAKMRIETKEKTTERDLVDGFVIISTLKSAEAEFINYRDEAVKCRVEYYPQGRLLDSQPNFEDKIEQSGSGRRYQDINPTTKYV